VGARRRYRHLIAAAAVAALPATAAIAAPSNVDISRAIYAQVKPPDVGRPSHVKFSLDVTKDANRGGRTLRSAAFRFARGFRVDRSAVGARCSNGQARSFSCPPQSLIGSGSIVASVAGGTQRVVGQLKLYLGTAQHAATGAVAADVRAAGHRRAATGRIVRIDDPVYAYELRIDGLNSATGGGQVEQIHATIGATRTSGGRTESLVTNPKICPGGWHYGVVVTYKDGTQHRGDGAASCRYP